MFFFYRLPAVKLLEELLNANSLQFNQCVVLSNITKLCLKYNIIDRIKTQFFIFFIR